MNIGLTGASGFIGRHFTNIAAEAGHQIIGFSRTPKSGQRRWDDLDFSGLDAMVHLAGESVFGLWTQTKKRRIHDSRVGETRRMVEAMRKLEFPPRVIVSASGSAFYGERGDELLTENSSSGEGFLAGVTRDWEVAVAEGGDFARSAFVRMGMVLGPESGGWPKLRTIFKLGLGGRLGSGKQWMPWIHVEDAARLFLFSVEKEMISGPVNGVASEAATNAEFTKELAAAVHRPAIIPTPAFALKLLPGGVGEIFLDSARIEPQKALEAGFVFKYPTLKDALNSLLGNS